MSEGCSLAKQHDVCSIDPDGFLDAGSPVVEPSCLPGHFAFVSSSKERDTTGVHWTREEATEIRDKLNTLLGEVA